MIRATLTALVGLLLALSGAAAQEPPVLNVYNWTDYIAEDTLKRFTAETGIKVNYDVYDSNESLDAKLRAGKSGYDLVVPTASPFLAQQVPAKLYQPLDRAKLTNYGNLDPKLMAQLANYDPGNRHAIPWMWGTTGIGYNIGKIKAIMPDAPVDSLRIIFDPALVAKFSACGVVVLDSATDVVPAALLYLRLNPDSKKQEDLDKAAAMMAKMRRHVRKWHSSDYLNDLANGDACLVFGYSGDVIQAAKRAREAKRGVEIAYAIPREGALVWTDTWAIPVDAPHPLNAHRFLDFLMRPEIAAANSNFIGYANGNAASLALIDRAIRDDPVIYPSEEVRGRLYTITPANRNFERARTRAWTRITTGK